MRGIRAKYFYLTLLLLLPLVILGALLHYLFFTEIPEQTKKNLSFIAEHLAGNLEENLTVRGIKDPQIFFATLSPKELTELKQFLSYFPEAMISFVSYPEGKVVAHFSNKNGQLNKDSELINKEATADLRDIIVKKKYPFYGRINLSEGKVYTYLQPVHLQGRLLGFYVIHQNKKLTSLGHNDITGIVGFALLLLLFGGIGYSLHYIFRSDYLTRDLVKSNWDLQRKLNAVLENALTGIIMINRQKAITYINPMAEKILKVKAETVLGKNYEDFVKKYLLSNTNKSLLIETLDTGKPVFRKEITFKVNGEVKFGEVCTGVVFNILGQIDGAFLFIQDITEKRQKEELNAKNQQLAAAGEILAELTHELKNAFMVLRGLSKLCQDGRPELKMLDEEITRLYRLTQESLSLAKTHRAKRERFDFHNLVVETLALIDKEAKKYNVKVESFLHYPPYFSGDRNLLKQALLNVLLNAIEAMDMGGILKVYLDYNINNREMVLTVADSGPGIPQEILNKISQPFFTTKEKGTGLGLPFTRRVVEFHLGKLIIKSEVGKGTWVIITLPVEEEKIEASQVV